MTGQPVVVICVGNDDRGDDGVALAVHDVLRAHPAPGIDIVAARADPVSLIGQWDGREAAIVVDAVRSGATTGTIHRVVCHDDVEDGVVRAWTASSHGLGLATALALARQLDMLPDRLVVLGVEVADMSLGAGLSPPVAAAVEALADAAMREARTSAEACR